MTQNLSNSETAYSDQPSPDQLTNNRTRLPILLGVLAGMIVWFLLMMLEDHPFQSLTVWVFSQKSGKALFAMPGYYCVHRTVLLLLAAMGGAVGIYFSQWPRKRAIFFLLSCLLVVAIFAALGFR